jgi:septal ring factor EnvC (AmiA/AmiB activator)
MSDIVLVALIAAVPAVLTAIVAGVTAVQARRNKRAEADKTQAEAEEIMTRVRAAQLVNAAEMMGQINQLRGEMLVNEAKCSERLEVLERGRESDRRQLAAAKELQQSLENEIAKLQTRLRQMEAAEAVRIEEMRRLQAENEKLKAKIERLASRVDTSELDSGAHRRE